MEYFDIRTVYLIGHIFGAVLGAGAAFMGDFMFIKAIKDKIITTDEFRMIRVSSQVTWVGVAMLVISGIGLFSLNPAGLMASSKFQAKMVVVLIIIINGLIFHHLHIPKIKNRCDKKLFSPKELASTRPTFFFLSGVISVVSWIATLVFGSVRGLPWDFWTIMLFYLIAIAIGGLVAIIVEGNKTSKKEKEFLLGPSVLVIIILLVMGVFTIISPRPVVNDGTLSVMPELTPKAELALASPLEEHLSYVPDVPPAITREDQRYFEVHLEVLENVCSINDKEDVMIDMWGYRVKGDEEVHCGAPGPVLRGRVGDVAKITLTNLEGNKHPHNIDFHAVTGAGGGAKDLTVAPGETASIEVRLLYPGAFMYHCAYGDVPVHIMRGMYGMFIVDPETPLPEVDHEWAITQSEWYITEPDEDGLASIDKEALSDEEPTYIVFNGKIGALTGDNALNMDVGERARIYFVNEGLNLDSNFHPIGSHWDVVYPEGATHESNRVIRGSQSTLVVAGGGTVVELVGQVPLTIKLVDHALSRTFYKGALGLIHVAGDENPELFEVIDVPKSKMNGTKHDHREGQEKSSSSKPPSLNVDNLETYTKSEVAAHDKQSDCWLIIDDLVYDMTELTAEHKTPYSCGKDRSASYHRQHGPDIKDEMLPFLIGRLE